jgi:hypothetical protein
MNERVAPVENTTFRLTGVREGMPVYDLYNAKVGTVKHLQFPNESADDSMESDDTAINSAPGPVRTRLVKSGFIKINTGLLRKDAYATADQIEYVGGDGVQLSVSRDMLTRL